MESIEFSFRWLPVVELPNERSKIHLSMVLLLCTPIYRAFRLRNIHATHFAMPNVQTHLRLCLFENDCPHHVRPIRIEHFQTSRPTSICPNVNEDKLCLKIVANERKRKEKSVKLRIIYLRMRALRMHKTERKKTTVN